MKPAGIILTYMRWREWKWLVFNVALLLWQIVFMVMGKIYGKVKVRWRDIWRAAQVCHVRLVLRKIEGFGLWQCVNFGYPKAEIQHWPMRWIDGKRFSYRDPTFDPSPEFIKAMIEYAYAQVGKRYDHLQLASYCLNLFVWIIWPWSWGKEVFAWLNLRGGREICSSGVTADLRWGEKIQCWDGCLFCGRRQSSKFFRSYDTATVPPCLFPLDENWRERCNKKLKSV